MKKRGQRVKLCWIGDSMPDYDDIDCHPDYDAKTDTVVLSVKVVIADSIQGYLAENEAGDWKWYLFPEWEEVR